MPTPVISVSHLPTHFQGASREFGELLIHTVGKALVAWTAYGGQLAGDVLYAKQPLPSVLVLQEFDLKLLDRLAREGHRFGQRGLAAPISMTVPYIAASRDVFPLELLEIREHHAPIIGPDHFAGLTFERRHVRLQCERELKAEMIQMRRALVAAAGRHDTLTDVAESMGERFVRVLRGVLLLLGRPLPSRSCDIVARAAEATDIRLETLRLLVETDPRIDLNAFERLYNELTAFSLYMDTVQE